ncbi:MarR family winged helix-turn-helix transcriptional regulator [Aestuariivirga sp.]|uniref:MarR family winged helix-turn-helix transcriptional regulator n=1 Tax=Aestuariivirga sp. TaxID=2650926 RepID=UPI0035947F33
MTGDLVREYGYLTLGSRFKRIGERMQADVQRLTAAHGFELHGALWTMLAAIDREGPLSVGELAQNLGIAQPGVTRSLAQLEARGFVSPQRSKTDQRVKRVALTEQGHKLVDHAKREIWPLVERAVAEICEGLDGPLLEQLSRIEDALAKRPLDQRVKLEDAE